MCPSSSSCCSNWRKRWTLLFWDLVKPSRHHCEFGYMYNRFDPSSSSCTVCRRSGSRHIMSSSWTIELANSSSWLRLLYLSLTRLPSRSLMLALPPVVVELGFVDY
jgi:hypothetical protein